MRALVAVRSLVGRWIDFILPCVVPLIIASTGVIHDATAQTTVPPTLRTPNKATATATVGASATLGSAVVTQASTVSTAPANAAAPTAWTPELSMQVKRIGVVQPSPDGRHVAFVVRSAVMEGNRSEYVSQIHRATADGRDVVQLTFGDKSSDDVQWSPDGRWLAFVSDRVGKKNLWLLRADGGEARQLTHMKSGVGRYQWMADSRAIVFAALDAPTAAEEQALAQKNDAQVVDENIKRNGLYLAPVDDPPTLVTQPRRLTPPDLCVSDGGRAGSPPFDISPDGKTVAFAHVRTTSPDDWMTSDVSVVDVAEGTVRSLVQSPSAETAPRFAPDGRTVALVISRNPPTWGGSGRVHVLPTEGGTPRPLAEPADGLGRYSELLGWTADGRRVLMSEAHGTSLRILELTLDGKIETRYEAAGFGNSGAQLNARRTHLGFAWETTNAPPEAWLYGLADGKPQQVSRVHAELAQPPLGRTEVVRWKSTEGFEIEGLLTYPVGYEEGKRYPLLLVVHGGPMGVFSQTYVGAAGTYPVAVFASRGYAVLRPNPRGSSGYGHAFRHANYGDWGGGDYRDLMSGVDHVIARGVAGENRLGVMGWSYGGFMTSWIITQTKRFRCASVGAGVTNLMSFTGTADIPGFLPDYFGGEFWDRPEVYAAHSAMFRVKGVTTPTLIQHGERDERVPLSQGQELYNALKRQGCNTKMVVYPRTPHGIEEPRLLLDAMRRNVDWFEQYLGRSDAR